MLASDMLSDDIKVEKAQQSDGAEILTVSIERERRKCRVEIIASIGLEGEGVRDWRRGNGRI